MRARALLLAAALLLSLLGGGCFTMRAELPGVLRSDVKPEESENLGPLNVEKKHWFLLHGLLGRPPKDLLAAEIRAAVQKRGGDGVAGLRYQSESSFGDALIGACSLGCVVPRSYQVTGTIVRLSAPRLPGRPAKLVDVGGASPGARVAQRY